EYLDTGVGFEGSGDGCAGVGYLVLPSGRFSDKRKACPKWLASRNDPLPFSVILTALSKAFLNPEAPGRCALRRRIPPRTINPWGTPRNHWTSRETNCCSSFSPKVTSLN